MSRDTGIATCGRDMRSHNNMHPETLADASHDMDHASTPVNSSFLSPIRKFDDLRLDESDVGDRTLDSDSDSDMVRRPVFVKRRRDADVLTPHDSAAADSFSASETTPCPAPAKKKLKFKDETPVKGARPRLLDVSHSVRTAAVELAWPRRDEWDDELALRVHQSTPISQSTPASSRPALPPSARALYHARRYEIVAEIAADDAHVGDQRIDPYLCAPCDCSPAPDEALRELYDASRTRVPLLAVPPRDSLLAAITTDNLRDFYSAIKREDELWPGLLRRERVRWHPDRWVGDTSVDRAVVEAIAMVVNGLLSTHLTTND